MIYRCQPNTRNNYGFRGITVCDRWKESFYNFIEDMGRIPSLSHELYRIRSDRNYEPGNCRWATKKEQNRNRSNTIRVTCRGETKALAEWCEQGDSVSYSLALSRLKRGWDPEDAIFREQYDVPEEHQKKTTRGPQKQRDTRKIKIDGVSKPLRYWCRKFQVDYGLVYGRIRAGWDPKRALTEPPNRKMQRHKPKACKSNIQTPPPEPIPEGMTPLEFMKIKANRMAELQRQAGLH